MDHVSLTVALLQLVPGDIVGLSRSGDPDKAVPCDVLLLSGGLVVNEALLTGESVPQAKVRGACVACTAWFLWLVILLKRG